MNASSEIAIIGGGLAGSMTALRLAGAGRAVALFERERTAHHKVCGEFLSPEAVAYLRQAGVEPMTLGAVPIDKLRLSCAHRVVQTRLPFTALSLSRQRVDAALQERAREAGCTVHAGVHVEGLEQERSDWILRGRGLESRTGLTAKARSAFIATGKHDLRGCGRPPGSQNDLVGFKLHWRLDPAQGEDLRGWMDLFLFRGGYGGLSLVEDGVANLCLVVQRDVLRRLGGWAELLAHLRRDTPALALRLRGAQALWERPLAISSIPYGYLAEPEQARWRIGDQAAVIPSFTGDGMSIALHSASLAADMYLAGKDPQDYTRALRQQLGGSMRLATSLSRAMVTRPGQALASFGLSVLPEAMNWIARLTRIPTKALLNDLMPQLDGR